MSMMLKGLCTFVGVSVFDVNTIFDSTAFVLCTQDQIRVFIA